MVRAPSPSLGAALCGRPWLTFPVGPRTARTVCTALHCFALSVEPLPVSIFAALSSTHCWQLRAPPRGAGRRRPPRQDTSTQHDLPGGAAGLPDAVWKKCPARFVHPFNNIFLEVKQNIRRCCFGRKGPGCTGTGLPFPCNATPTTAAMSHYPRLARNAVERRSLSSVGRGGALYGAATLDLATDGWAARGPLYLRRGVARRGAAVLGQHHYTQHLPYFCAM